MRSTFLWGPSSSSESISRRNDIQLLLQGILVDAIWHTRLVKRQFLFKNNCNEAFFMLMSWTHSGSQNLFFGYFSKINGERASQEEWKYNSGKISRQIFYSGSFVGIVVEIWSNDDTNHPIQVRIFSFLFSYTLQKFAESSPCDHLPAVWRCFITIASRPLKWLTNY